MLNARKGVIIEWPLNEQFHDARDVILTSRNDVRGFPSDDDDDEIGVPDSVSLQAGARGTVEIQT